MRIAASLLLVIVAATVGWHAAAEAPPPPGPGWKRVGDEYHKTALLHVVRSVAGNVSNHFFTAENGDSYNLSFADDGTVVSVQSPHGGLRVEKEGDKVQEARADLLGSSYYDIDANGIIDAWVVRTEAGQRPSIMLGDRIVPIENMKGYFRWHSSEVKWVWGVGRKTAYVFAAGKWEARDGATFNPHK